MARSPTSAPSRTHPTPADGPTLPTRSATLEQALEMGESLGTLLSGLTRASLSPEAYQRLQEDISQVACRAAYGGMAAWIVAGALPGTGTLREAAETLTGVSLGLLTPQPMAGGRN